MVPVKLTLSNFLSYGSEAQTLDFSRFHVACLSGKNGQGKSALLDALTWALWGEARKSSGAQKPDEELLRIGSRRMSVELVFDVEGDRYRVIRSYSRSATGKTSKSELEVQLIAPETKEGIPLTTSSIRETQEILTERLGLDYDAFVNSAFLLQGRSDEFTKKKPAERKNILGRILNLGKYDRLAEKARLCLSELKTEIEKLNREIELFSEVLEDEKTWKADFEGTASEMKKAESDLSILTKDVAGLVEQTFALQSIKKELESLIRTIKQSEGQKIVRQEELAEVNKKIDDANTLIGHKGEIHKEYQAILSLQKERDELDTKRDIYRGIETQLQTARSSLTVKRAELVGKVQKYEYELRVKEEEYSDAEKEAASKESFQEELEKSIQAKKHLVLIEDKTLKKKQLDTEINELEQYIYGQKRQLTERYNGLNEQVARLKVQVDTIEPLKKQLSEISLKREEFEQVKNSLSDTREEGQKIAEEIIQIEGHISIAEKEKERIELRIKQLENEPTSNCPTCGALLPDEKKSLLLEDLESEKKKLKLQLLDYRNSHAEQNEQRELLRNKYRLLVEKERKTGGILEKYHQVKERLEKCLELKDVHDSDSGAAREIKTRLENEEYAQEERKKLGEKRNERDQLVIDPEEVKRLRFDAAQIDRYEERLRKVEFAEGKKENLYNHISKARSELAELRRQLDSGEAFTELKASIMGLEKKLVQCEFNPERFESIKQSLKDKDSVTDQLHLLLEAEKNMEEWEKSKKKLGEIIAGIDQGLKDQEKKRREISEEISKQDALEEHLEQKRADKKIAEHQVFVLQEKVGELKARLAQVEEAKQKRKVARSILKEKKEERNVYSKLRTAFGRNGIQSLIIEQALPEIEERASEILHRLTDGKMRVHLETIKDKKSGGTKETLEIIITDEQGVPRAYETYSGGEAFRINFALRIALSQMLAERNGVRIRTLGIDEGFGTQDEDGIQHLIEAIQQVQDDFDKILVITHLNRLKEAFPVRIEVVKDPVRGSQFTVLEH